MSTQFDLGRYQIIADGYTEAGGLLNRAIRELPSQGGTIALGPGDYRLEEPIQIQRNNVTLIGAGREATRLLVDNDLGCGVMVGSVNARASRISIADLTVNTSHPLSTGCGVQFNGAYDVKMWRCLIANMNCGIEVLNSSFVYLTDLEIIDPRAHEGVGVLVHGDRVHNDQYLTRVFVQCPGASEPCEVGFRIANSQGIWVNSCGAYHCGTGLHLVATPDRWLEHVFLSNNAMDNCVSSGFRIDSSPSGFVRRVQSTGDWSSSNRGSGILVIDHYDAVHDIAFRGARLYNNGEHGVAIQGGSHIAVDGSSIAGNGRLDPASSGIHVESCKLLMVRNNTIGAYSGFGPTHNYGISGLDRVGRGLISGNVFEASRTSTFDTLNDKISMHGNLDLQGVQ
ncbi:right-handed parallel beta-helix repeat-containing protein [Rhodopseudomonas sp.]|uniref:right-handed parallel beta-helix repeat-containing protein n=1 Tax=Rhodopseudomonas sp. TaxID=1078 RepID=UPI003B3B7C73